ncbi:ribonuclease T2 [Lentibacter algarum]|uniref:ribonuclease T2 family protein n=1 Tax=Lentibacter algarum TaxID=576131 RepID=UPI001C072AE7|nr:ribonuclease T2 [Lentibacter algarum]MBU2981501.1 ribonuclease T2 [Lentibacter algarum]
MRIVLAGVLAVLAGFALAKGEKSGQFDYYVMALSWSPNWCALEGEAKGSPQCDEEHGWVLHGLWPQFHRGWPSFCATSEAQPSRSMTRDMADIMGTSGLAWYQWKKHGVCSGLSVADYYALSREAYRKVVRPPVFRKLSKAITLPASVVEEAFLKANPQFEADMVTVTCKAGHIQEVRVCLSKNLSPVPCGRDVVRDCTLNNARFEPID